MDQSAAAEAIDCSPQRPGILVIGSPDVGKRTLLSRLLSVDIEHDSDSTSDVLSYGWTINTKYYTADVAVWMSHLYEDFSITNKPIFDRLAALVMVFDMHDLSSFSKLKEWVSCNDIQNFDILLCIGNKADLVPGHSAHAEYRRRLINRGQPQENPIFQSSEYGISETEGNSLLRDDDDDDDDEASSSSEIKRSCMEWCLEHNIEYIEACASNAQFDKCLSVDGDLQGVERVLGALSAHMWPGMILKSGDVINQPSLPDQEDSSDEEEPNYEIEYEILSAGSIEPWDDTDVSWVSADTPEPALKNEDTQASTSQSQEEVDIENPMAKPHEPEGGMHFELEDMEQLMSEIGNTRDSLRLIPDFQRREMAAKLALKMAAMFGDSSCDEGEIEP